MGKSWIVEMLLWCFSSCGTFASTAFCFIGKVKPKDYNISVHEQNKEHIYAHNWRTFERQYWRLFYCSLSIQCTCTKIWAPSPAHTHLFDLSSVINDKIFFHVLTSHELHRWCIGERSRLECDRSWIRASFASNQWL